MTNPSPDLIQPQVEAESVDTPDFRAVFGNYLSALTMGAMYAKEPRVSFISHIDSIITVRVAAAYEAGRLAASPAAPAGQHDASLAKLREVATWIDSQCNQQQISAEEFCYPTQFDYDLAQAASELFALAAEIEQTRTAGSACQGGNTNPIDTLAASLAAPELINIGSMMYQGRTVTDWAITAKAAECQAAPAKAEGQKPKGCRDAFNLMDNARRIANAETNRSPNWALAMDLFSVGRTSGHEICVEAGIDPDSKKIEPSATSAPQANKEQQ